MKFNFKPTTTKGLIAVVAMMVALVAILPFLTIWAVNTLFPIAAIPYNWQTWLAMMIIGGFIRLKD